MGASDAALGAGTGVREEHIDRALLVERAFHECRHRCFVGDVESDALAAQFVGDRLCGGGVVIGDDDMACAFGSASGVRWPNQCRRLPR